MGKCDHFKFSPLQSVNTTWKNLLILMDDEQMKTMRPDDAKRFKNYKNVCVHAYNLKVSNEGNTLNGSQVSKGKQSAQSASSTLKDEKDGLSSKFTSLAM